MLLCIKSECSLCCVSGYLVHYSTDPAANDIDWVVEGVIGEHLTTTIRNLRPETTYYFKVQARNDMGYGPLSQTIIFRTPRCKFYLLIFGSNYR